MNGGKTIYGGDTVLFKAVFFVIIICAVWAVDYKNLDKFVVGCFEDKSDDRVLPNQVIDFATATREACLQNCAKQEFTYAGLEAIYIFIYHLHIYIIYIYIYIYIYICMIIYVITITSSMKV